MKLRSISRAAAVAALCLFADLAVARFARPSLAPTERLLERASAHLKANPQNAKAHYTLGRIHYLSFYNRASEVAIFGEVDADDLPKVAPYWTAEQSYARHAQRSEATNRTLKKYKANTLSDLPQEQVRNFYQDVSKLSHELAEEKWNPAPAKPGVAAEHATLALKAFDKAIDLDPQNSLFLLGKASLLEQAKTFYTNEKPKRVDPVLAKISAEQVRDAYYRSFANGVEKAQELKHRPVAGLRSIASYEAGTAYKRLCETEQNLSDQEKNRLTEVEENLAQLDKLRRGAITPIIFSLKKNAVIDNLLEPGRKAKLDLDGDGISEEWPWVREDTAFLVWDPARSGRILSGRQLFGSYTWQIPFENGYQALAMLDATDDGQLNGVELDGIRAWFDRNGNGQSEPGEVIDLASLGIEAIATVGELADNSQAVMTNRDGVQLRSGKHFATWDWVPLAP